jgi:hypothetical protein
MKKIILPVVIVCMLAVAVPAHAFLDYLFGGSASRDAIDNSAVGDIRAWWTGNPAYQFNPYYSAQQQNPVQGQAAQGQQMGAPQMQPPTVTHYPPQDAQQPYYGQTPVEPQQGMMQQQYQTMPQQYQTAPQGYQQMPQQQYQAMPQQYQAAPQAYMPQGQPPAQYPPQAYQQTAPQQYQAAPQAYPAAAQQYPGSPTY